MGLGIVTFVLVAFLGGAEGSASTDSGCGPALGCTVPEVTCAVLAVPPSAADTVAEAAAPWPEAQGVARDLQRVSEGPRHTTSMC